MGNSRNKLGFMEFKQMYGDGGFSDEELWEKYMEYYDSQPENNANIENTDLPKGPSANGIGRSKNINSNTDFSGAGVHTANTKHVPYAVRKGGM